jgi:hypothetical protein
MQADVSSHPGPDYDWGEPESYDPTAPEPEGLSETVSSTMTEPSSEIYRNALTFEVESTKTTHERQGTEPEAKPETKPRLVIDLADLDKLLKPLGRKWSDECDWSDE